MFQRNLPAKQRCDLCGSSRDNVYQVNENGYLLTFCSPDHARTGVHNWEDKIAKGIKPGVPYKEEESGDLGENIEGGGNNE
jgi:hypothetical protein